MEQVGRQSAQTDSLLAVADELTRLTYFRGRVALAAILRALGIRAGDEVLLQAFTCVAVPEAIMSVGARPTYVDVEERGVNMDPADLEGKIGSATKAIIIQHSFGLPADVIRLREIARSKSIPLIEDCAHAIASRVDGQLVGTFGNAAFYSYEAAKPVFAGIGGSAIANDDVLRQRIASDYELLEEPPTLTQLETAAMVLAHRIAYQPATYWTLRSMFRAISATGLIPGNYNKIATSQGPAVDFRRTMGRIQVGALRRELKNIDKQTSQRRTVGAQYRSLITSARASHMAIPANVDPVFGRYPLFVEDRSELIERARAAKVEVAVFYDTPVHPLKGQKLRTVGYEPGSCPNAEWASDRIISLPTGMTVGSSQIQRAVNLLNG